MNQELLTKAIAFFKDQHGTYQDLRTQMLAGGLGETEIAEVYSEIQRLGLDKTSLPPEPQAVQTSQPGTFTLPPISMQSEQPHLEPSSRKGLVATVIFLFLVLAIPAGIFGYAKYKPQSSIAIMINKTFGMKNATPVTENQTIATTTLESTTPSTQNFPSPTYHNKMYGFTITFPEAWKDYRVEELPDGVWFGIKDQNYVLEIIVFTKQDWEDIKTQFGSADLLPELIAENAQYVFVTTEAEELPESVVPLYALKASIFSTFAFTNQETATQNQ